MIGQRCKRGNPFSLLVLMTLPVYADLNSRRLFFLLTLPLVFLHRYPFYSFSQLPGLKTRAPLPGDHRRGVPPVPIPNTAVKPSAANGSRTLGPARVGCCQVIMARLVDRQAGPLRFYRGTLYQTAGAMCATAALNLAPPTDHIPRRSFVNKGMYALWPAERDCIKRGATRVGSTRRRR